ncbi:hypothetical protein FB45DRAFT_879081 [Roridomyces roridus]|uniref:Uncharacterized protein n=1 Tax=Roridomyces roridus TaxID=1738132 RepID=A0AAD7F987_9AGAR|nr:hypothetical protein FB45DRAFT_879081 [Roridomyces roridus]
MPHLTYAILLLVLQLLLRPVDAALSNLTIDDTNSIYWSFSGPWDPVTPTRACAGCGSKPDPQQTFNSTWHVGTLISGSFSFQGVAVYIYGIDVPADQAGNISFTMKNPSISSFHYGSAGSGYGYNSLFFTATNLDASVQHTVNWVIGPSNGLRRGDAVFDYAQVSQDDSSSEIITTSSGSQGPTVTSGTGSASPLNSSITSSNPASSSHGNTASHTGKIVGAVVGAITGLALIAVLVFILICRRRPSLISMRRLESEGVSDGPRRYGSIIRPFPLDVDAAPSPYQKLDPDSEPQLPTLDINHALPPPSSQAPASSPVVTAELEERLRNLERATFPPAYS